MFAARLDNTVNPMLSGSSYAIPGSPGTSQARRIAVLSVECLGSCNMMPEPVRDRTNTQRNNLAGLELSASINHQLMLMKLRYSIFVNHRQNKKEGK
jgi:hypothetical protein